MKHSLSAAATGLHLGLLLCCVAICGCDQAPPGPTLAEQVSALRDQADDLQTQLNDAKELKAKAAKAEADNAAQIAELKKPKALPVAESPEDEFQRFAAVYPNIAANIQRLMSLLEKTATEANDHSILTEDEQREKFAADYPVIAKQLDKPKSCPMPEVDKADLDALREDFQKQLDELKPKAKSKTQKRSASNLKIDAFIKESQDAGLRPLIYCRQTKCGPCDTFDSLVLDNRAFNESIGGNLALLRINVTDEPDIRARFKVSETPTLIAFDDCESTDYHRIVPPASVAGTLAELNLSQPEATAPRKRLRNLFQ